MKAINIVGVIETMCDPQLARGGWLGIANAGVLLLLLAI